VKIDNKRLTMINTRKLIIYQASSQLRDPWSLMLNMLNDLKASRFIAFRLFQRDLKAKYRQSLLGYFWAFVPSIVVTLGLVTAANAKVISVGETQIPYPAFVMLSMVLWQTFVEALNAPLLAISESRTMLSKIKFPRESIIIAKILDVFFNFFIKMVMIIFLYLIYEIPFTWSSAFAFIGVFQIVLFGIFLGLLIAPIGVIYHDISRGVTIGIMILFFVTPVVFPEPKIGLFSIIVSFNPLTTLMVTTRELATSAPLSNLNGTLIVSGISLLGFLVTWLTFRLSLPYVIERMPS